MLRALLPGGEEALEAGRRVLRLLDLVRLNDRVVNAAGVLRPPELRSLDAIHLATAERVRDDLGGIVTYDERLAAAAKALGYRVAAPA